MNDGYSASVIQVHVSAGCYNADPIALHVQNYVVITVSDFGFFTHTIPLPCDHFRLTKKNRHILILI